eukprot:2249346-Amphidinium_carterae.1
MFATLLRSQLIRSSQVTYETCCTAAHIITWLTCIMNHDFADNIGRFAVTVAKTLLQDGSRLRLWL